VAEITRRLAAVAFADVAGWSRLIEKSDVNTLRAWKAVRADLIEPRLEAHGGRLLEIAGDAVLVEFPSAVDAVNWGIDVQRGMRASHELAMRIGINVEDVIVDDGKLVGTGINIAARIQQLAAPGEIVVTAAVHDYVANKIDATFADLGVQKLRNISRKVRLYRVDVARPSTERDKLPAATLPPEPVFLDSQEERTIRAVLDVQVADPAAERSEEEAITRWRGLVDRVANGVLPAHGGRLLKSLGGDMLLDFPHAPVALKAAFDIQRICDALNASRPAEQRVMASMGMQVGELIADDHGVYGRDLNLAARLREIAGPGEIVVSAGARDQLTPMLDADIEDLGECYVKNLSQPIRAYRVGPPGPRPVIDAASAAELKPTIAVIPFLARSSEKEHQVIGEVLADEVISALSRSADVNVISRLSTTTFRGRNATATEVGQHLNATYVLSGAYRVSRSQISVVAEVAEAASGHIIWSDDLAGDVKGIIAGKGDLIDRIVTEAGAAIMTRELHRAQSQALPTLQSYTLLMAAITLMHRLSPSSFNRAHEMLTMLCERAPRQAIPSAWLGKWHVLRVQQGWSDNTSRDAQMALDCTRRALDVDPHCSLALSVDGFIHTNLLKKLDVGLQRYDLAIQVNPSDSLAWLLKGTLHAFRGEGKQAVKGTQRALRLSPLDPHHYFYDSLAASASLSAGDYKGAIDLARRSLRANRTHTSTLRVLAIAQWQLGRQKEARETVRDLLTLEPSLTVTRWLERSPSSDYDIGKLCARALKEAGVPS